MISDLPTYAQDKEDLLAVEHFGREFKGRFLDLGAYDGLAGSNTYLLAQLGWEGVEVEPNWRTTGQWIDNVWRKFGKSVQLVQGAIGLTRGLTTYWDSAGPWSTCHPGVQAIGRERTGAFKMHVPTFTPGDLIDAFPGPFHVVSVDIDGWSLELMRSLPWDTMGTRFAVIEAIEAPDWPGPPNERQVVREYMQSRGFYHLCDTLENVVMVR
jgi:FkbM family methyltransferase